jgi:hypothetical protein
MKDLLAACNLPVSAREQTGCKTPAVGAGDERAVYSRD